MPSSTVTMDDDVLYEVVAALVEWRNREASRLEDDEDVGEFVHELLAPLLSQRDRARATAVHLEQENARIVESWRAIHGAINDDYRQMFATVLDDINDVILHGCRFTTSDTGVLLHEDGVE